MSERDASSVNAALKDLYLSKWAALDQIRQGDKDISWPLLLKVHRQYFQVSQRLLIVGQQTYGWGCGDDEDAGAEPVTWLMDGYTCFALGHGYTPSPFWQASHQLYGRLNPNGPPLGFLWSNLVKVDMKGERPVPHVEDAVCQLGLVRAELEIVRPDIVVFFTGTGYDARLRSTFPEVRFVERGECLVRLEHTALPHHTYRTPHPLSLRLSKKWDTLDNLTKEIGASV